MTGCGALSAVSGILDSNHGRQRRNGPRCPPQVPPPSAPAARWPRRADTDRTARLPGRNRPGRGVRPPVHSPGCWTPRRRVRPSAAIADGRCAARIRTPDGDAAGVSDTRCPQRGRRTGRCPPAQRPADVTVEAVAEGPQRFRPGGGNGTGCRTPDPGHQQVAPSLDTPSARRTTWPHIGQDAGSSGRSIRGLWRSFVEGWALLRSLRPPWSSETGRMRTRRPRPAPVPRSDFAGFRFPRDVIVVVAVRWYLRFGLSYRDVEELLAERGVEKAAAGRGRHRPGSDLSGRAGGTPPGGVASHRAVRQQPGRGRPWASEGAAAIDARLQARPQRSAS
jgi:hypothetical protein